MEDEKNIVLVMSIEINDSVQELRVHQMDDPEKLASEFCQKNSLGPDIKSKIIKYIEQNLPSTYPEIYEKSSDSQVITNAPILTDWKTKYADSVIDKIMHFDNDSHHPIINPHSKQIMKSKSLNSQYLDVFDRLNLDAKKSKNKKDENFPKNWRSKSLITSSSQMKEGSTPCSAVYPKKKNRAQSLYELSSSQTLPSMEKIIRTDLGVKLYRNCMEQNKNRDNKLKSLGQEITAKELKEATFRPKTMRSMSVGSGMKNNNNELWNLLLEDESNEKPEVSLLRRYSKSKERLQMLKESRIKEIMKECIFKPTITKACAKLAEKRRSTTNAKMMRSKSQGGELLMENADNLSYTTKDCTFHPNISGNYSFRSTYSTQPVIQRLLNSKMQWENTLKNKRQKKEFMEKNFDLKTGQKLHRPIISRGPLKSNRGKNEPIHEHLYQNKELKVRKRQAQEKAEIEWQNIKKKTYTMKYSNKLLESAKYKKCEDIFSILDPDNCGTISKSHIHLDYLSTEALDLLSPILLNMENQNISLTRSQFACQFINAINKLKLSEIRKLNCGPKYQLTQELQKSFPFKPQISANSQRFAQLDKRRPIKQSYLFQQLYSEHEAKLNLRNSLKSDKEREEIEKCTFSPKIHTYQRNIFENSVLDNQVKAYAVKRSQQQGKSQRIGSDEPQKINEILQLM